ncbi:MAG: hypothetical protein HUJ26_24630 [Planctomycetaceae bacterium]|nr:hypothetical protein [Planctomycetaceae bacterium]
MKSYKKHTSSDHNTPKMNVSTLAYIGPENAMPLLSAIATLIGVVLMAGKTTLKLIFQTVLSFVGLAGDSREVKAADSSQNS